MSTQHPLGTQVAYVLTGSSISPLPQPAAGQGSGTEALATGGSEDMDRRLKPAHNHRQPSYSYPQQPMVSYPARSGDQHNLAHRGTETQQHGPCTGHHSHRAGTGTHQSLKAFERQAKRCEHQARHRGPWVRTVSANLGRGELE